MNSTSTDRSISSSISLPQWMKTKIGDRYDLEQAIFSSPSEDDSFFFIRYPFLSESKSAIKVDTDATKYVESNNLTDTQPESTMKRSATVPGPHFTSSTIPEEGSSSSSSVVSVAQNMLGGKIFGNYLSSDQNTHEDNFIYHNRQRRNSKSLPTSPLSSPKISRKNPYFTDPFTKPGDTLESGKPGWILSILSQRKSIEDLTANVDLPGSESNSPRINRHPHKISSEPKPKPSELREMNFWSPVSM